MSELNKSNCSQISEMLGAFRDMELDLNEVEVVENHLEHCPTCTKELASIEMVVATIKSLPDFPTKDFADAIEARILTQTQQTVAPQSSLVVVGDKNNVVAFPSKTVSASASRSAAKLVPHRHYQTWSVAAAALILGLVAQVSLSNLSASVNFNKNVEVAQVINSSAPKKLESDKTGMPISDDIVALYDEEGASSASDAGITTNEDGLYALKL